MKVGIVGTASEGNGGADVHWGVVFCIRSWLPGGNNLRSNAKTLLPFII
jgi:hypothetical protein